MKEQIHWLTALKQFVERKPVIILRFEDWEWESLCESRRGITEFTIARPHSLFEGVRTPTPCLIRGGRDGGSLYFGLISSRSPVSTLESRVKVRRVTRIRPDSEDDLVTLVTGGPFAKSLRERLSARASVVTLSPKLSSHLIDGLASIQANRGAMRVVAESLTIPRTFEGTVALQEDAVRAALRAFGLSPDGSARSIQLIEGRETALGHVGVMEDSVIEHDARCIPGYSLMKSDLTGRAVFEKGGERLEVFTANRRPLEQVFGVDLIYLNTTRQNVVMLQYKMLEPQGVGRAVTDWIYRVDATLDGEIRRMGRFATSHVPGPHEYRLNPEVFYLKFVKRDGRLREGAIIVPIGHFEKIRKDPVCQGPRRGLRVSYEALRGRYLRQDAFLDLLQSGYIGAHAETTAHLKTLVEAVLNDNWAVVAAIQEPKGTEPLEPKV